METHQWSNKLQYEITGYSVELRVAHVHDCSDQDLKSPELPASQKEKAAEVVHPDV